MYKSIVKRLATSIALLFAMYIATAPQSAQAKIQTAAIPATAVCPTLDANRTIIDMKGTVIDNLFNEPSWKVNWSGCDLSNTKLGETSVIAPSIDLLFMDSNFSNTNFSHAQFSTHILIMGGILDDANFSNATFTYFLPNEVSQLMVLPASAARVNWTNVVFGMTCMGSYDSGLPSQYENLDPSQYPDFSFNNFTRAKFTTFKVTMANITNSKFTGTKFTGIKIGEEDIGLSLKFVVADGVDFSNQDLSINSGFPVSLKVDSIKNANFEGTNLAGQQIDVGVPSESAPMGIANSWSGSNFTNAVLRSTKINWNYAGRQTFTGANFTNADFTGAKISGYNSGSANFTGSNFTGTSFMNSDFTDANLSLVKGKEVTVNNFLLPTGWKVISGYLVGSNADLSFASLYNKNLSGMDLSGARLNYADLSESNLTGANLTNAKMNYANFTSANLSDAILVSSQLDYANLHRATLTGSDMSGSSMFGANMTDAIVGSATGIPTRSIVSHAKKIRFISTSRTNLSNANFANANLAGSNFNGTNLYKTNFYRANLNDTTFVSAIWNQTTCVDGSLSGAHLANSCMAALAIPGTDYNLTYEYNSADGGTSISYSSFKTRGSAILLPTPTRTGYTFAGWYSDSGFKKKLGNAGAKFSPTGRIVALNSYAKWTPIKYVVTFNSKGGSTVARGSFASGGQVVAPRAPTRTGYTFAGWSSTDGGAVLTFPYAPSATSNVTLFAKWIQNLKATATVKPTISGTPSVGQVLTTNRGTWTGFPVPTFTYQWYSCTSGVNSAVAVIPSSCKIISMATTSTLTVTNSLRGKHLAVSVGGTSAGTSSTKWLSSSTTKVN
jgi:uncharacterized repeat protein (TIGR02543 family)